MRFRLVWYQTQSDNKYDAEYNRFEYLGSVNAIWTLWFHLSIEGKGIWKHVEVFSLDGARQHPEKGMAGMSDYNP